MCQRYELIDISEVSRKRHITYGNWLYKLDINDKIVNRTDL